MQSNQNQNSHTKPQNMSKPKTGAINNNKKRPENKDNLDHREGEEQNSKGDDVTHNKKETKENHLKEKKNK